jgi:wyosine [tRNA(Phe)-imidazoG37] synthetase (radical SAM superfamily)
MLDISTLRQERSGATLLVTRSRLRFFAKATGQTDLVYVDVEAAREAGHRDLPVPPAPQAGQVSSVSPGRWPRSGVAIRST